MKTSHKVLERKLSELLKPTGEQSTSEIRSLTERIRTFIDYADTLEADEMSDMLFMSFIEALRKQLEGAQRQTIELAALVDSLRTKAAA